MHIYLGANSIGFRDEFLVNIWEQARLNQQSFTMKDNFQRTRLIKCTVPNIYLPKRFKDE